MRIYLTLNKLNGKLYIGRDSLDRNTYLGSGVLLKQAIEKYGKENFQKIIVEQLPQEATLKDLIDREYYYLQKFNVVKNDSFYNLSNKSGGFGLGDTHTNEAKIKQSIGSAAKYTLEYKKYWRNKVSQVNVGRIPWNKNKKMDSYKNRNMRSNIHIPDEELEKIRILYNLGNSATQLGKKFKYSHHTILKIVNKIGKYEHR